MAVNNVVHVNEGGLPLNAVEWLVRHHQSKLKEREQMIEDLCLKKGSFVVDAGCGPGLWTPLLAQAIGVEGHILGIDIDTESLVTAQRRSNASFFQHQVQYKYANLEEIPIKRASADIIFSANVSQYLPDPVATFAAMGPYLKRGGRLIIKDIDFGTLRFYGLDPSLQARVFQARERWELERCTYGYAAEDSWIGSKLAGYMRAAGFDDVEEKSYCIVRPAPLSRNYRFYIQGIAEWFVCENAPYLSHDDVTCWLKSFFDETHCVLDRNDFMCEETEFVVSGIWNGTPDYSYEEIQTVVPRSEITFAPRE